MTLTFDLESSCRIFRQESCLQLEIYWSGFNAILHDSISRMIVGPFDLDL